MKLDALDHPKTLDFAARLSVSRPTAIGHLELLWGFTARQSAQGNVGKWPDGAIARACDWMDSPEVFIAALIDSGFLDRDPNYRLTVHDWSDHAPGWVRAKLKKVGLNFISSERSSEASNEFSSEGSSDGHKDTSERSSEASKLTSEPSSRARVSKGRVGKGREDKTPDIGLTASLGLEHPSANGSGHEVNGKIPWPAETIQRVFEHWRTVHDHPQAKLDKKRRALIAKALHAYDEADLCQSISGYKNSPHHMGRNDRNTAYDSIELLLRDAAHVDAGLKFYADPPAKGNGHDPFRGAV